MTREELFLAIGQVEETRLARCELGVREANYADQQEMPKKKKVNTVRILRNLLVAAIIVSMLGVTAYAVGGYLIYDSPEEMVFAIFGDKTGYDHKPVTTWTDPWKPGSLYENPAYDRVPADETVVAEDIAPHVSPVGQSISYKGYTLMVDAFLYDSATQCGLVTYVLEDADGTMEYSLQSNGEVWYNGMADPVSFSQYGYSYIIQDKSTDGKLTATYYFHYDAFRGEEFSVCLYDAPSVETRQQWMAELMEQVKAENTPEEAIAKAKEILGAESFEVMVKDSTYDTPEDIAYKCLRDVQYVELYGKTASYESPDKILFDCSQNSRLTHVTLADGAVTISPISFVIDIIDLEYLHKNHYGDTSIKGSNVEEVVICFTDGTEYLVKGENVDNTLFALMDSPNGSEMTERFVSAEEAGGEGYWISEYKYPQSRLNLMLNRVIDVEKVSSVRVNGTELPID